MASHNGREIEIKLAVADAAAGRAILRGAGFRVSRRKVFESNTVFDTPGRVLRGAGRFCGCAAPAAATRSPTRALPTPTPGTRAGKSWKWRSPTRARLAPSWNASGSNRSSATRNTVRSTASPGGGVATLDETPIGVYLELEGSAEWIDRTAAQLGFAHSEYITASYAGLYIGGALGPDALPHGVWIAPVRAQWRGRRFRPPPAQAASAAAIIVWPAAAAASRRPAIG